MAGCDEPPVPPGHDRYSSIDWTATVDEGDLQEQRDEILALQSIYEGGDEERIHVISEPDEDGKGLYEIEFTVPIQMPSDSCQVDIWMTANSREGSADTGDDVQTERVEEEGAQALTPPPHINRAVTFERSLSGQRWTGSFTVKYLSPLTLHVTLPPQYPSQNAPAFTLSCVWLSGTQLGALCRQLDELWEANMQMPVIFTWLDWLETQTLSCLGISDSIALVPGGCGGDGGDAGDDDRAIPDCWDLGQAVHSMLQYSNDKEAVEFCKSIQECCLCFDEKPGTQFFRLLPCKHHFCVDCMVAHCTVHVTDGTLQMLTCPGYECKSTIQPHVLQAVLPPDLFLRWEKLSLQRTLDEMEDIVYCPRCQSVVIRDQEMTLNLGHCLACFYSFCTQCEQPWHQGSLCKSEMELVEEKGRRVRPGDEAARQRYEELKRRAEENAMVAVMKNGMVRCPKCKAPIEKIAGCNKMTCRCGQQFCWLCRKAIDGYSHFRNANCGLMDNQVQVTRRTEYRPPPEAYLWMRAQMDVFPDGKQRTIRCVTCKQENLKSDNNNHIRCWNCKAHLCFYCKTRITGVVTRHFIRSRCPQHS